MMMHRVQGTHPHYTRCIIVCSGGVCPAPARRGAEYGARFLADLVVPGGWHGGDW